MEEFFFFAVLDAFENHSSRTQGLSSAVRLNCEHVRFPSQ